MSASSSTLPSPSLILGFGWLGTQPPHRSSLPPVVPEPTKPVSSTIQGLPVVKPRPTSLKLPLTQLPTSLKEPMVPASTKVLDISAFKFRLSTSSVFSLSQQPITPTKSSVNGFPSPTATTIHLVFSQPIATAAKATPPVASSPSSTMALSDVFSPFKSQNAQLNPQFCQQPCSPGCCHWPHLFSLALHIFNLKYPSPQYSRPLQY